MKVGILTYHDGPNHGAYLQAFSLMKIIEEDGHEVEIINYKNQKHWFQERIRPVFRFRRPIRFKDYFDKYLAFKKAHQKFNLTKKLRTSDEVNKLKYDVVYIGSDVVWNYKIFGFDDVFFGNLNSIIINSYAASFGWVNSEESLKEGLENWFRKFEDISVRDFNSQEIIRKLIGIKPAKVLDPTLIYDLTKWEKSYSFDHESNPYILMYSYVSNDNVRDRIIDFAHKKGLKIIGVGYRHLWYDESYMDVDPFEWLELYRNASYIGTSTFHGTIFSLKYNKNFFYFTNNKAKTRVSSLFKVCGINDDIDKSEGDVVYLEPNYEEVNHNLEGEIRKSREWLFDSLSNAKAKV